MRKGATYYDSSSKAGVENEILFYVELKENSKVILPNFTELVKMEYKKENGERYFDFSAIKSELEKYVGDVDKIEIYYDKNKVEVRGLPENVIEYDL